MIAQESSLNSLEENLRYLGHVHRKFHHHQAHFVRAHTWKHFGKLKSWSYTLKELVKANLMHIWGIIL